jgi:hypothetical protein
VSEKATVAHCDYHMRPHDSLSSCMVPHIHPGCVLACRMDGLGPKACSLSVLLVTELVDESLEDHLPINSLRNQAVLLAQTPLVAMLDADMVVSRSLAESLADPVDAEVSKMPCRHTPAVAACRCRSELNSCMHTYDLCYSNK